MAKNVTYFVAGSIDDIEYESTIALMINVQSAKSGHGELLLDSQTAVKDMQLSHGMDPVFYLASSRMFRVTVEEVPREGARRLA